MTGEDTTKHPPTGDELSRKVSHAALWALAANMLARGLNMGKAMLIPMFLAPDVMGTLAIIVIAFELINALSEFGFDAALIQREQDIDDKLDAVWCFNILRGLCLAFLLHRLSPWIASRYHFGRHAYLLDVVCLGFILQGSVNPAVVLFAKELDFRKQFLLNGVSYLTDTIVTLILVMRYRSIAGIVAGLMCGKLVLLVASFSILRQRPRPVWNLKPLRELFQFSLHAYLANTANFLSTNIDDLFVGIFLGNAKLGIYRQSYTIASLPAREIGKIFSSISFPMFAKLRHDICRLKRAYFKLLTILSFLTMPIAGCILYFAEDFVKSFWGPDWHATIPVMMILSLWGALRSIGGSAGPIYLAMNRPHWVSRVVTLRLLLLIAGLYPAAKTWGLIGVCWLVVLLPILSFVINATMLVHLLQCRVMEYAGPLLCSLCCVCCSLLLVHTALQSLPLSSHPRRLLWGGAGFCLVYAACTWILERLHWHQPYTFLLERWRNLRQGGRTGPLHP